MLLPFTAHRGAALCRLVTTSRLFSSAASHAVDPLEFQYNVGLGESDYTQVLICDDFPSATAARQELENDILGNPRTPSEKRFVWDPWFVSCSDGRHGKEGPLPGDADFEFDAIPGERECAARQVQFSNTRAQCNTVLSDPVFEDLLDDITELANSIGCGATTPPWMSLYGDGQMQNFHTDPKQGCMAWTLSLSQGYGTTFTGGETILLTPTVLDYWRDFDGSLGREAPKLARFLPPLFGRFTAFDPRVPHMVQKVSAPNVGPLQARIMIHGWFSAPENCWFGDDELREKSETLLDDCLTSIAETMATSEELGRVMGFLSVRVQVSPDGTVTSLEAVCDTLQNDPADSAGIVGYDGEDRPVYEDAACDIRLTVQEALGTLEFPETENGGYVVVPFNFE